MSSIYVQVPAYRDCELSKTLLDLYAKAARPGELRVGVVWQRGHREKLHPAVHKLPNLELTEVPYQESRGCNWARNLLQSKWRGEAYTLLIDSHQRFVQDWDALVLSMYGALLDDGVRKPLLTGYLPSYDPLREPGGRKKRPYKIYPARRDEGLLTRLTSHPIPFWTSLKGPIPADFLSLHFAFARGEFNREILIDPEVYFFGDEVLTGARAFTAGYDLFHPHRIVGWHCYDRRSRVPHWDDHTDWHTRHRRSLAKIKATLRGDDNGGPHSLGGTRSIADYEARIMLNLVEH